MHFSVHCDPSVFPAPHTSFGVAATAGTNLPLPFDREARISNQPTSRRTRLAFRTRRASRPRAHLEPVASFDTEDPDRNTTATPLGVRGPLQSLRAHAPARNSVPRPALDSAFPTHWYAKAHQGRDPIDHQPSRPGPGKHHTVDDDRGNGPTSRSCATPSLAAAPPLGGPAAAGR